MDSAETPVQDHFAEVRKMVRLGSGAEREVTDYKLTRYACYLIAMNGDTRKQEIAFAQAYFAVQTLRCWTDSSTMSHGQLWLDSRQRSSSSARNMLLSHRLFGMPSLLLLWHCF